MSISNISGGSAAFPTAAASSKNTKQLNANERRLADVGTQFESLFAEMLVQNMYKSAGTQDAFFGSSAGGGQGPGEKLFNELLQKEYAQSLANEGALGIGQMIFDYYKDRV